MNRDYEKAQLRLDIVTNGLEQALTDRIISTDNIDIVSEILKEAKDQLQAEKDKKTLEEL